VFSNVSGKLLDSTEVMPVLRHIATLGVPIHLHPAIPLNRVGLDTPSYFLSLGFPCDTSLSALRLIWSGLFDEAPDLNVIVAHVGGVIPYLAGRIGTYSSASALVPEAPRLPHPLDHCLGRLYVDTVCLLTAGRSASRAPGRYVLRRDRTCSLSGPPFPRHELPLFRNRRQ
jgi:hypothetical protein